MITAANDFSWEKSLSEFGGTLLPDEYDESVRSFVIGRELDKLDLLDHASHYSNLARLVDVARKRVISHLRSFTDSDSADPEHAQGWSNVVASYERSKRRTIIDVGPEEITLESCPEVPYLLDRYRQNSLVNLGRLNGEVQKRVQAWLFRRSLLAIWHPQIASTEIFVSLVFAPVACFRTSRHRACGMR